MHCVVLLIVPYNQQANAVEVTWEDQKRINSFGRLHNRKVELLSHVKAQEVRTDKLMDSLIRSQLIVESEDVQQQNFREEICSVFVLDFFSHRMYGLLMLFVP